MLQLIYGSRCNAGSGSSPSEYYNERRNRLGDCSLGLSRSEWQCSFLWTLPKSYMPTFGQNPYPVTLWCLSGNLEGMEIIPYQETPDVRAHSLYEMSPRIPIRGLELRSFVLPVECQVMINWSHCHTHHKRIKISLNSKLLLSTRGSGHQQLKFVQYQLKRKQSSTTNSILGRNWW